MKTIQTKPGVTLGFVKIPEHLLRKNSPYANIQCLQVNKNKKTAIDLDVIGILSEITEEQVQELCGLGTLNITYEGEYRHLVFNPWNFIEDSCIYILHAAVKSVGIEEKDFDQYLVIKL